MGSFILLSYSVLFNVKRVVGIRVPYSESWNDGD